MLTGKTNMIGWIWHGYTMTTMITTATSRGDEDTLISHFRDFDLISQSSYQISTLSLSLELCSFGQAKPPPQSGSGGNGGGYLSFTFPKGAFS